jgi:hypothetical protein
MARKNLGRTAVTPREIIDKQYADTKYTKPPSGIPGSDLAPKTISIDRLAVSGTPSALTWARGDGTWAPILGNNISVQPSGNYTLQPPNNPYDGELVMFEILPTTTINVAIPNSIKLTTGMVRSFSVPAGIAALVGIRWSQPSNAWQLIAATVEVY